ncbi:lectin alpha chain-like [Salvia hispanica]|uniref:lectin alpha chain-like n=1 Tax=Salvia hispanica TaxID=49212 RepID=UPI002009CDAC|nr:lectin alpha chain-like [Salvia hispanica]
MANFLQILIPLISLLLAAANSETTSYDLSNLNQDLPIYQGDAHFHSPLYRLTKTNASGYPQKYSVGRVLDPEIFKFEGLFLFTCAFQFVITPVDNTPADGLTFFIAPAGTTIPDGSGGANFGVFSPQGPNSNIFAVEFDTFFNPGIDATSFPHVGIDIESPISSNLTVVGNDLIGNVVSARIFYEQATNFLNVSVAMGGKRFEVSYVVDLSSILQKESQVGLSAATGEGVAIFDIRTWLFNFIKGSPTVEKYLLTA